MIKRDRDDDYEYPFKEICLEYKIIHRITAPRASQFNRIAKRKNRTLKEMRHVLVIKF